MEIMWVLLIKITGQALLELFWYTMLFSKVGGDLGAGNRKCKPTLAMTANQKALIWVSI
jgi:hypothetical protein